MALLFDHLRESTRDLLAAGENSVRPRAGFSTPVPDHICLRLIGGWLVALTALLALVLMMRLSA